MFDKNTDFIYVYTNDPFLTFRYDDIIRHVKICAEINGVANLNLLNGRDYIAAYRMSFNHDPLKEDDDNKTRAIKLIASYIREYRWCKKSHDHWNWNDYYVNMEGE